MAGDWIKIDHTLPTKPEVSKMAGILRKSEREVVGALVLLWIWTDQHSIDGKVNVDEATLDRRSGLRGFSAALRIVGWLVGTDGEMRFPRFDRHNGATAKARVESNRRVAEHRNRKGGNENVTENLLQKPLPEGEGREEKRNTPSLSASESEPAALLGAGRCNPDASDGQIPTKEEVVAFGRTAGVPIEYSARFFCRTEENHRWLTPQNRLVQWRKQLMRFWNDDKPTWTPGGVRSRQQQPQRQKPDDNAEF